MFPVLRVFCRSINVWPQAQATCSLDNHSPHRRRSTTFEDNSLPRMAPHLAESQHVVIGDMIASKVPFKAQQIANVAGCSRRAIHRIRSKRLPKASPTPVGRP
jgi:hypothetical protein